MSVPGEGEALDISQASLLILDMQHAFVHRGRESADQERLEAVIRAICRLADAFRSSDRPVIYTRVCFRHDYADAHRHSPARHRGTLLEDDPSSAVITELAPQEGDFTVIKRRTGAFHQTDLELLLAGLGVRDLVVTGLSTPRAVESTVREAHSRDFDCYVVRDGTFADEVAFHDSSLGSLGKWFATLVSSEDIVARGSAQ